MKSIQKCLNASGLDDELDPRHRDLNHQMITSDLLNIDSIFNDMLHDHNDEENNNGHQLTERCPIYLLPLPSVHLKSSPDNDDDGTMLSRWDYIGAPSTSLQDPSLLVLPPRDEAMHDLMFNPMLSLPPSSKATSWLSRSETKLPSVTTTTPMSTATPTIAAAGSGLGGAKAPILSTVVPLSEFKLPCNDDIDRDESLRLLDGLLPPSWPLPPSNSASTNKTWWTPIGGMGTYCHGMFDRGTRDPSKLRSFVCFFRFTLSSLFSFLLWSCSFLHSPF
jgi:hypothetical protein